MVKALSTKRHRLGMYQNYDGTDHHGVVIAERHSTANYVDYGNSYVPLQNPVEGTSVDTQANTKKRSPICCAV